MEGKVASFFEKVRHSDRPSQIMRVALLLGLFLCAAMALVVQPIKTGEVASGGFLALLDLEFQDVTLTHCVAMGAVFFLFGKTLLRGYFLPSAFLVALLLGLFYIAGLSLSATNDLSFIAAGKRQLLIAALVYIGVVAIVYSLVKMCYGMLDSFQKSSSSRKTGEASRTGESDGVDEELGSSGARFHLLSRLNGMSERRFFVFCACLFLVVWFLLALPYFPGSVPHDGRYELNMYYGYQELTLHHTLYATMLMGAIYDAGSVVGGSIGGCVLYVLFQSVLGAIVFSRICLFIRTQFAESRKLRLLVLVSIAYYALAPMWWTYMQTLMKDTLYFIVFSWFVLEMACFLTGSPKKNWMRLILSAIFACLLRNEAKYIVVVSLVVLTLFFFCKGGECGRRGNRFKIAGSLAIVVVANLILNMVVPSWLGLSSLNKVESLGVPLQQIARYVSECEDELTQEDKNVIDQVVVYEGLADRYDPVCADPVKDRNRSDTTDEEWTAFWGLWRDKFVSHPDIYLTAALNNAFGYVYPFYFYEGLSTYQLYSKEPFGSFDEGVIYSEYVLPVQMRDVSHRLTYLWAKIPILSFVVNPGFYTWMLIVLLGAVLRKREWEKALLFIAPGLCVAVCMVSPVNGLLRYMLPVMATMPLLVAVALLAYRPKSTYFKRLAIGIKGAPCAHHIKTRKLPS